MLRRCFLRCRQGCDAGFRPSQRRSRLRPSKRSSRPAAQPQRLRCGTAPSSCFSRGWPCGLAISGNSISATSTGARAGCDCTAKADVGCLCLCRKTSVMRCSPISRTPARWLLSIGSSCASKPLSPHFVHRPRSPVSSLESFPAAASSACRPAHMCFGIRWLRHGCAVGRNWIRLGPRCATCHATQPQSTPRWMSICCGPWPSLGRGAQHGAQSGGQPGAT